MPFQFRQAFQADLPQLLEWTKALMAHEAIEEHLELPLKDNLDEKLNKWLETLLGNENALFIIAENADNQPSGCILGLMQLAPNDFIDFTIHGMIQMVWVEPNLRRSGLAGLLVEHMENTFRNLNIPYCEISHSMGNEEAAGFWQAKGYTPVSQTCRKFLS